MNSYLHQPREVSLETFALCNARCTFCPYPTLERKGTKMSFDTLDRLIGEMKDWPLPFFISPFKVNEPLLDDRMQWFCEEIEQQIPSARLRLFTNGQPLTPRHRTWIANLKRVEHLWVSLNEYDPQRYGEVMGLSLHMVAGRLDDLHDEKESGAFPHRVVVSRVSDAQDGMVWTERDNEFMNVVFKRWPRFTPHLIKRDGWLGYVEPSSTLVPRSGCGRWFELSICADGKAALCCMDGTGEYAIGNVHESTLLDIYNQPHLVARRLKAHTRAGIEPCQRCTY